MYTKNIVGDNLKKKVRIRYDRIFLCLGIIIFISFLISKLIIPSEGKEVVENKIIPKFENMTISEVEKFSNDNNIELKITYDYNDNIEKDHIITQSIPSGSKVDDIDILSIVVSLGKLDLSKLEEDKINELGKVPVMMYHGIVNMKDNETKYTGGNVDSDGYNRTTESFIKDLEFYYNNGYRMIRLIDYVNGNIDTPYGYSPIVLTFDDGNENNIKVTGIDDKGDIIIDPNSAIGILESFKKKYPDFNVTATFFVNGGLFNQPEYNDKIIKWLINNGYDVGNHTYGHNNLSSTTTEKTQEVIASVYKKLNEIIPDKYVNIIALPFGNPTNKNHDNFPYVINGSYNGFNYNTLAALRVGWEPELSPYHKNFDITYIKRCRAYDNNGSEFDIEMVFKMLEITRYISDGNKDIITTFESNIDNIIETDKRIITY